VLQSEFGRLGGLKLRHGNSAGNVRAILLRLMPPHRTSLRPSENKGKTFPAETEGSPVISSSLASMPKWSQ